MHYIHKLSSKTIERIVGGFILFCLISTAVLSIGIAINKKMYEKDYRLITMFKEGYGVKPGTTIKLVGIDIGQVEKVGFNASNLIEVRMKIKKTYQEKIRADSIVTIGSAGLAGDKILSISIGTPDKIMLTDKSRILSKEPIEITDLTARLNTTIGQIETIMKNVVNVSKNVNNASINLDQLVTNINTITQDIVSAKGSVGMLIANDKLYKDLERSIENIEKATVSIKSGTNDVPKITSQVKIVLEEVNKVVLGLQKHWLVSDGVKKAEKEMKNGNDKNKVIPENNKESTEKPKDLSKTK